MNAQERLREVIDQQQSRLRAGVPADREGALLALIRGQDRLPHMPVGDPVPDIVTGHRLANPGGNEALQLCLCASASFPPGHAVSGDALDRWAEPFLKECGRLAEAEMVLAHCESGFMRMVDEGHGRFDAWIATKRAPTRWRERADIDWWARWLARRHAAEPPDAEVHLKRMAYQLSYPPEAVLGGCTVQTYRDVLRLLIGWALAARERGEAVTPRSEHALVAEIASVLDADPAVIAQAVAAFTLDRENAAWHAAVPGVAAAPLVRVGPGRIVWSVHGLTTEPLLFLARELRRRDTQAYHNTASLREGVFRQELYALFTDKRFVTSTGRIQIRRDAGDLRTDIDAAVFDRKTGTLGLFELKSQDPFARSTAELVRQRDNVLYANRQISGVLDWLKRYGADALLGRIDARTAKTFRAQKVYPFVLGRYLAHFDAGPEPDRRAAWGAWPQVLRLLDGQPVRATEANPIASLFTRLMKNGPLIHPPVEHSPREIVIGGGRLIVHSSYAAFQAGVGTSRT